NTLSLHDALPICSDMLRAAALGLFEDQGVAKQVNRSRILHVTQKKSPNGRNGGYPARRSLNF
uniref:hypothetical protein n=1 Tax=Qipengyuania mesophila TaxID=2867246 RepID=UPI00355A2468